MHRILFFEGTSFPITSFGFMVGLGILIAAWWTDRRHAISRLDRSSTLDFCLVSVVSGILGARILYVLLELAQFMAAPNKIWHLWEGGISWYGAIVGGFLGQWIFCRIKGVPLSGALDMVAPPILLAHGIGRIGCFLNGCCYGEACDPEFALAVKMTELGHPLGLIPRHPSQLYEAALDFIFLILLVVAEKRFDLKGGKVYAGFVGMYAVARFISEFFREGEPIGLGLTLAQWASLGAALVSFGFMMYRRPEPIADPDSQRTD